MVADSITDFELFHGSPISRDFAKKRKTNWFCELKQWKIDARRRQSVYQWKRANVGEEEEDDSRLKSFLEKLTDKNTVSDIFSYLEACGIDHEEGSYDFTKFDETDLERASSASSSPTSVLKNKNSGSNKSSDDCFCCSKQVTEEEEDVFDDAYDNFDGFRDALNFFGNEDKEESLDPNPSLDPITNTRQRKKKPGPKQLDNRKQESTPPPQKAIQGKSNKKKKKSKSEKHQKKGGDEKSECPICSEEMDETDLSFLPCPCGYQLCLFCHKRICEDDARCPSCRKVYDQTSNNNNNSGEVSFQQRSGGTLRLSPSFRGLDRA